MSLTEMTDEELDSRAAELEEMKTVLRLRKVALRDETLTATAELAAIRLEQTARHIATRGEVPPPQIVGS